MEKHMSTLNGSVIARPHGSHRNKYHLSLFKISIKHTQRLGKDVNENSSNLISFPSSRHCTLCDLFILITSVVLQIAPKTSQSYICLDLFRMSLFYTSNILHQYCAVLVFRIQFIHSYFGIRSQNSSFSLYVQLSVVLFMADSNSNRSRSGC